MKDKTRPHFINTMRRGLRCALTIGLVIGVLEGLTALQLAQKSLGNLAARDILQEVLRIYGTSAWVEGLACSLLAIPLTVLLFAFYAFFSGPDRSWRSLTSLIAGVSAAVYLSCYAKFYIQATIPLRRAIDGTSFDTVLRVIFVCFLLGAAVGLLVFHLYHRRWAALLGLGLGAGSLVLALAAPFLDFLELKQVRRQIGEGRADGFIILIWIVAAALAILLFWRLAARVRRGRPAGLLARWLDLTALLVFAALSLPGWWAGEPQWKTNSDPVATSWKRDVNVILISVDTLRGDRLEPGNPRQVATPNINRLISEGVIFTEAEAPSPWTLPSVASMLTSLSPPAHGTIGRGTRLSPNITTLAEAMANEGLASKAVVANAWLSFPFNLYQGFENYEFINQMLPLPKWWPGLIARRLGFSCGLAASPYQPQGDQSVAGNLMSKAMAYLEQNQQGNFFLWIHLMDPHDPYVVQGRYQRDAPRARGRGAFPRFDSGPTVNLRAGRMISPSERKRLENLYNLEIRYTDDQIGRLLDHLQQLDLDRKTMIILTSDHGEEFWEHGNVNHGHGLHRELLNIPLIVRPPQGYPVARRTNAHVVRLIDVAPTVLDYLGIEPPGDWAGQSLLRLVRGEESGDRPAFAGSLTYYQEQKSVRLGRYKYILTPSSGQAELYDLETDRSEQINVAAEMPTVAAELRARLDAHLLTEKEHALRFPSLATEEDEADELLIEELKALGYVQ